MLATLATPTCIKSLRLLVAEHQLCGLCATWLEASQRDFNIETQIDASIKDTMNLDLNLGSFVHPPQDDHQHNISFEDLLHGTMIEVVSNPSTTSHRSPPVWSGNGGAASVADNDDKRSNEKDDESSFFDCNICLDLASEPVVTCCGHLFCWPCIYRWLFVHSNAKQCPICKGEVTMKSITPIYSRSNRVHVRKVLDPNTSVKIPSRPQANRIESWRHSFQRDTLNFPVIEMVRRLDNNRFHLSRDPVSSNPQEVPSTQLLNRIFTSRGIRRGRDSVPANSLPDVTVDLPNDHIPNLTSAESFIDSYFHDHPDERSQAELPLIDRHSMASVADIIQSEILPAGSSLRRRRDPSTSSGSSRTRRRLY
ncbi:hypothetical protein QVD17_17646 [Tagetes erecta]|uniref:E3 ubiquitin-protein ligase RMA n=1 Tax=Tagetes erecta TaxID=13708 RepID=A0AAD8P1Q3_TARER|nr:hypothetical protein QVD17_17646 [Tagetes erecta]